MELTFALAPGVIMGYDRNTYTFKSLEEHGYILKTHEFLEEYGGKEYDWSKHDSANKIAIGFEGTNSAGSRWCAMHDIAYTKKPLTYTLSMPECT